MNGYNWRLFLVVVLSQVAMAEVGPLVLFYNSEAPYRSDVTSNEALPIGNGKLAAMVYGGRSREIIQFNEDTVWAGQPHDYTHPGAADYLKQIQDHVWEGHGQAAWQVAKDTFMSIPLRQCPYQPTAELHLTFNHADTTDYRRQLDLTTATASVRYQTGGVTYNRDCFASYPNNVIVVRLTASQPGHISFTCGLTTPHQVVKAIASDNDVVLHGAVNHVGRNGLASDIEFESRVRILNEGGSVTASGQTLEVRQADAVTLVLGAASNFVRFDDISGDPSQFCLQTVNKAAGKGFDRLRRDQLKDYQSLFNRVTLDLGTSDKANNPTDVRLGAIEAAVQTARSDWSRFNADDLQLVTLNFQMARYLMISGSRPGSQPLNLQGKWNNEVEPSWEGKMTLNINEEMNYWGAEVTNLAECHEPLFQMIKELSQTGKTAAVRHYGADGWMVHHNTDLWRASAPINSPGGLWPTGAAWLSMHLWWHYEYSGDPQYLAEIYPLMKDAAAFFVDFLVEDPRPGSAGYLLTNPTHSPEQPNPALGDNGETIAGPTMDSQLIRELFTYVIEASKTLDIDADLRQQLTQMRKKLPPNQIGQHGQLQEWLEDVDQPNQHRHMSHLVDLMPAGNITPIHTPKLADAVEVVLDWKGDPTNNTSWSQAWKMCCRTRLLQGDHAYMILNKILGKSHTDNMTFSRKGNENQIDGNLGVLMGTAELFLQSHQGEVFLLPALPSKMKTGSVTGLRARGGFEVDIAWQDLTLRTAKIHSSRGQTCRIRSVWPIVVTDGTQSVTVQSPAKDLYEFPTQAGHTYQVTNATDLKSTTTTTLAKPVDSETMQSVYDEIKTPYKYGRVVFKDPDYHRSIDCPTVFRSGDDWYMMFVQSEKQETTGRIGYTTQLARSEDLLHWERLGTILPQGNANEWDYANAAGGIALTDLEWGGSGHLGTYEGQYWMSYFGGDKPGYETAPLAIGRASTTDPAAAANWTKDPSPMLTINDPDTGDWEDYTLYKSFILEDPDRTLGPDAHFVIFYNAKGGQNDSEFIGMATSSDMRHWKRHANNPVIANGGATHKISGDPQIVKINDVWVMFYFGFGWGSGCFDTFACSYDLVHWTKWNGPNLIEPTKSRTSVDKTFAHKPWIVKHNGVVYHYYCAVGDGGRTIALATSVDMQKLDQRQ